MKMKKEKISLDKLEEMLRRFRNQTVSVRLNLCPFSKKVIDVKDIIDIQYFGWIDVKNVKRTVYYCEFCNYLFPEGEGLFNSRNHPCNSIDNVQEVMHALFPDPRYTFDKSIGLVRRKVPLEVKFIY